MTDASQTFTVDHATDRVWGAQLDGGPFVLRTHPPDTCANDAQCSVHNPSDHHMRTWPTNWRADRYQLERLCMHGTGHPDPDDLAYHVSRGQEWKAAHGCDGCCRPPAPELPGRHRSPKRGWVCISCPLHDGPCALVPRPWTRLVYLLRGRRLPR